MNSFIKALIVLMFPVVQSAVYDLSGITGLTVALPSTAACSSLSMIADQDVSQ